MKTSKIISGNPLISAMLVLGLIIAHPAFAQTPDTPDKLPVKPLPVPTGVIPLPTGAPQTTQQAPIPASPLRFPKADKPLRSSPDLSLLDDYAKKRALTMQDAVAISLYTNRNLASAVAALQRAQGRTGQSRALLSPTLGVTANLNEYDQATTATFGGGANGNGQPAAPVTLTPQFNPVITTAFTLPFDLFGTLHAAASQAQFNEVASRIDVNRVRNQIIYDVKNAFYNVLRSQAQVAVATESVNNALTRLSDANKNYAAGTAPRFDVLSAQRDVADAQQSLINARTQVSLNLAQLKNTMGLEITTRIRIADTDAVLYPPDVAPPVVPPITVTPKPGDVNGKELTPPAVPDTKTPTPAPPIDPNQAAPRDPGGKIVPLVLPRTDEAEDDFDYGSEFPKLLDEALKTSPEILEAEAQVAAAQRGIRYARRSSLPSLSLSVSHIYTPNSTPFSRESVGLATLSVSVPIFDGGLARERVREARADVATAQINRRQSTDTVKLNVQQAYITLVQARSRVAVTIVELAQARETYRLARVRYNAGVSQQQGVSPQLELSNAQNRLTESQNAQINALYDYNSARAQLDRAIGRYSCTGVSGDGGYSSIPSAKVIGQTEPGKGR